jgi:hypothetical protein
MQMKARINLRILSSLAFICTNLAFAQPLDKALHGKWIFIRGKSTIVISDQNFKFYKSSINNEGDFSWIKSPPENGKLPEANVSSEGVYKVCFHTGSTISRLELLNGLSASLQHLSGLKKEEQLYKDQIRSERSSIKIAQLKIKNLSDGTFKTFSCKKYLYSAKDKSYEDDSGQDLDEFFFIDKNKMYRWRTNLATEGMELYTYQKK